jgi:hypothetical protein
MRPGYAMKQLSQAGVRIKSSIRPEQGGQAPTHSETKWCRMSSRPLVPHEMNA